MKNSSKISNGVTKKILAFIVCAGSAALLLFCLTIIKPDLFGLSASTWFSFQGNEARTGFSTASSPISDKIAWTYQLKKVDEQKGVILGSPAIAKDKVFFGAMDGKVHALNLKTGKELWTFKGQKSFWKSSPAISGDRLFIGSQDGFIYAININTGKQAWRYNTAAAISSSSPVVYNSKVYIGSENGYLYALDEKTGALAWKEKLGEKILSSPAAYKNKIYVGSDSPNEGTYELNSLVAANGGNVWQVEAESGNKFSAAPSVFESLVYIGGTDGKIYAFQYGSGTQVWSKYTDDEITSTPAIAYDRVYITNLKGDLLAMDKNNGHIYWRYATGSRTEGSPIVAEKKICFGADNGYFYCVDRAGKLIWKKKLAGKITAGAAASPGMIIVVSHTDDDSTITAFGKYSSQ